MVIWIEMVLRLHYLSNGEGFYGISEDLLMSSEIYQNYASLLKAQPARPTNYVAWSHFSWSPHRSRQPSLEVGAG